MNEFNSIYHGIIERGHRSVALICKTTKEATQISRQLMTGVWNASSLVGDNRISTENCLLIVPSHLAKGLEFDAVIIAAFDEPFRDHPIDRKLLYVAMTRPMHELHLVGLSI